MDDVNRGYVIDLFAPEDEILRWIQSEADRHGMPKISLAADEGRLLQVLIKAINAHKVLEIGTLAGYSGTWIARALPANGQLITLEVSSKHAAVARASFERAGVSDRVKIVEGEALTSLDRLAGEVPFDFVFMDADPENYPKYLRYVMEYVRPGGMITAHNALEGSPTANYRPRRTEGMQEFNQTLARDPRFTSVVLPFSAGVLIALKNR